MRFSTIWALTIVGASSVLASPIEEDKRAPVPAIEVDGEPTEVGFSRRSESLEFPPRTTVLVTLMTCPSQGCTGTCYGTTLPPTSYGTCYAAPGTYSSAFLNTVSAPSYKVYLDALVGGDRNPFLAADARNSSDLVYMNYLVRTQLAKINTCYNVAGSTYVVTS